MRVLMFGWEFPPYNSGGLGVACLGLTTALKEADVDVTFVLPKQLNLSSSFIKFVFADTSNAPQEIIIDSPLKPYMTSESYISALQEGNVPSHGGIYGSTLINEVARYAKLARRVVRQVDCDVIHCHDWLTIPAGMAAQALTGKPLVVHIHATEFDRGGGNGVNQHVYEIERAGVQAADRVIAVSEFTKQMLISHYDVPADKVEVVHNGINLDDYHHHAAENNTLRQLKDAGNKLVLFVGRFTLQKGPDYLLEAAQKVLSVNPNVYFVMTGSGDMEKLLLEKSAALGIADRVLFVGFLREAELSGVYAMADVFVMPSVSEPFGLVPLEAISNGVPVIISKQSGVSEVIKHSLQVDFWDTTAMADLILGVLTHKAIRSPLIENSTKEARNLTWSKAAAAVKNLYNNLSLRS